MAVVDHVVVVPLDMYAMELLTALVFVPHNVPANNVAVMVAVDHVVPVEVALLAVQVDNVFVLHNATANNVVVMDVVDHVVHVEMVIHVVRMDNVFQHVHHIVVLLNHVVLMDVEDHVEVAQMDILAIVLLMVLVFVIHNAQGNNVVVMDVVDHVVPVEMATVAVRTGNVFQMLLHVLRDVQHIIYHKMSTCLIHRIWVLHQTEFHALIIIGHNLILNAKFVLQMVVSKSILFPIMQHNQLHLLSRYVVMVINNKFIQLICIMEVQQ